jgi:hypothetical protein
MAPFSENENRLFLQPQRLRSAAGARGRSPLATVRWNAGFGVIGHLLRQGAL